MQSVQSSASKVCLSEQLLALKTTVEVLHILRLVFNLCYVKHYASQCKN